MSDSEYRVVWKLNNHIVGKVYALDQKNMCAMIADIEALVKEKQKLQQTVLDFQKRYNDALTETSHMETHIQQLGGFVRDRDERIEQLVMDVSHLKVQNDKYREALEFYSLFDFKGNPHFQAIAHEVLKVAKSCE